MLKKILLAFSGFVVVVALSYFYIANAKIDKAVTVEADFLMLACEYCLHMEIKKIRPSELKHLVGETIVPYTDKLDIEKYLYDNYSIERKTFCLEGKIHKYQTFAVLQPKAYRFSIEKITHGTCI